MNALPRTWTHSECRLVLACVLAAMALPSCSTPTGMKRVAPNVHRGVAVIVTDSLGAPAANVDVWFTTPDSLGYSAFFERPTDATGIARATILAGVCGVNAVQPGPAREVAGSTFRIAGSERAATDTVLVALQLRVGARITGTVTLAGRTDHRGSIVSIPGLFGIASSDSLGEYTLDLVPPGLWTVAANHFGFKLGFANATVPAPGALVIAPRITLTSDP